MKTSDFEIVFSDAIEIFTQICGIPHGSGNTEKITKFCLDFAEKEGLQAQSDESGNVIIRIDKSEDSKAYEPLILQGHLDMVCVKESWKDIDLQTQGLDIIKTETAITADGTSLGGDDGIAIAFCLALAKNRNKFCHPELELVFTTDEETGMFGAKGLDVSQLKGKQMINIDNEEERSLIVSCAGGMRLDATIPMKFCDESECFVLTIAGLKGGHSGTEINKNRQNAIKTAAEILKNLPVRLHSFNGGSADNAIANSCSVVFCTDDENKLKENICTDMANSSEDNICIELEEAGTKAVTNLIDAKNIIDAINEIPNGVISMSEEIENMPKTSVNLGVIQSNGKHLIVSHALRSSEQSQKEQLKNDMFNIYSTHNFNAQTHGEYPAWEYKKESKLRDIVLNTFSSLYNKQMEAEIIHAGLECGIFCSKIKNLDCVSLGPDIYDIHSTKETLNLDSAKRILLLIIEVLEKLED